MATNYTSLLGFALPVTGELSGTWGDTVNNSITQLEEDAIAGTATASVTGGDWTLTTTGSGAANEARKAVLIPTGTPGVSRNIVAPSQSKAYIVDNQSDANVVVKGAATSGVTLKTGETALVAWDGADFIKVGNFGGDGVFVDLSVTGNLTLSGGTANGVLYLNGSKVVTSGAALTFDGSSLGIGTSSPSHPLTVRTSGTSTTAGNNIATRIESNGSGYAATLQFSDNVANSSYISMVGSATAFGQAGSERMRIDSSGNVGVGITNPTSYSSAAYKLVVGSTSSNSGITIVSGTAASGSLHFADGTTGTDTYKGLISYAHTSNYMVFYTDAAERMRIDSSGNLLVGTTSGTQKLAVVQSHVSNNTASFRNTNASFAGDMVVFGADRNTTDNSFYPINYYNYGASAYKFRVADSGNVTNTNNSYGAISDAKLKENITDATPKLEKLSQVRIVNYNIIGDEQKQLGVIAQELELIFPGMVDESPDTDEEGNDLGTTTKSVKYSVFVPMLIKAIQEQQAIIESLKARLDAANL